MSVTITIQHNVDYCTDNDLVESYTEDCLCRSKDTACPLCRGTGTEVVNLYPYELNLSNANHQTLWNSLGLRHDWAGGITPDRLLQALQSWIGPELCVREDVHEDNHHSYGITLEQATRYQETLLAIAVEAKKRNEFVIWG